MAGDSKCSVATVPVVVDSIGDTDTGKEAYSDSNPLAVSVRPVVIVVYAKGEMLW